MILRLSCRVQAGESAFKAILAPVHNGDILGADMCIRRPLAVRERLNPGTGPHPVPLLLGPKLSTARHPNREPSAMPQTIGCCAE